MRCDGFDEVSLSKDITITLLNPILNEQLSFLLVVVTF